ncbi:sugar ABC transporter substrate-binding protein [Antarcticimicrobium sediminis]|uniref:Sugar ABC transporter substrate-binding protein n=1 Tax=Antarcticimicrobium sediminis TaxID=2546227 RepID=A0A4R5EL92_9RHOB|nr:sugar ABC transporter substrate-binding protein [Antarcticimicrobium sediminis]TDE35415.1 sugar ABC transporter substrate-binding protein [Antarcticimicrobium sediminis]
MMFKKVAVAALIATTVLTVPAAAKEIEQVGRATYLEALKGKRVIFIPLSQGMDLNQAWTAVWERHAARYGFDFQVRDPNMDTAAGIRALQGAIGDKPDVLIVQNPDVQTYARALKQAQQAGIKILQINMQSITQTDSYVGNDWIEMGRLEAGELAKTCLAEGAPSKKIVWLAGVQTGAANIYMREGLDQILAENPELELVSDQPADYDSEKARQITETVLQQHPDLCGIMGIWDNAEVGAGAAVVAAGKQDQVTIVTNGAGAMTACDSIEKGMLDVVYNFNAPIQAEIAAQQISEFLQHPERPAGSEKTVFFGPITRVDANNATGRNCWTIDQLK